MIQKEACVEVVGEVDLKNEACLLDCQGRLTLINLLILTAGPLPLAHL